MTALAVELGGRTVDALRAENAGLVSQRLAAIVDRFPACGWRVQYRDGVPVGMVWGPKRLGHLIPREVL